jgi:hypothetical protein
MTLPPATANGTAVVQRSEAGSATDGSAQREATGDEPEGGSAQSQSGNPTSGPGGEADGKGAAANDVHLLANEVWSLLRRRITVEAARSGRR